MPGLGALRPSGSARSLGGYLGGGDCAVNVIDLDVLMLTRLGHAIPPEADSYGRERKRS